MTFESLYAVIGIPIIFVLGFIGSVIPPLVVIYWPSYNVTKRYYFSFFNGIAGGVILAVGFIHSLSDSQNGFSAVLTDPNSLTDGYPWANFVAMMAILLLFTVEEILAIVANRFGIASLDPHAHGFEESPADGHGHHHNHDDHACDHTIDEHLQNDGQCDAQPLEEGCEHHGHQPKTDTEVCCSSDEEVKTDTEGGAIDCNSEKKPDFHAHEDVCASSSSSSYETDGEDEPEKKKRRIFSKPGSVNLFLKMILLFIGLDIHNIFVGLALGISDNDYVLFIALLFHQFFEGLGMGSRVAMAKLRRMWTVFLIDLVFAFIPVLFIAIGIGIKQGVDAADSTNGYNLAKGVLQGISAGILIYIALVHMLRAYRDNGASAKHRDWHCVFSYCGLIFGASIMSVIGIWA